MLLGRPVFADYQTTITSVGPVKPVKKKSSSRAFDVS